jgi:hypothetical protein
MQNFISVRLILFPFLFFFFFFLQIKFRPLRHLLILPPRPNFRLQVGLQNGPSSAIHMATRYTLLPCTLKNFTVISHVFLFLFFFKPHVNIFNLHSIYYSGTNYFSPESHPYNLWSFIFLISQYHFLTSAFNSWIMRLLQWGFWRFKSFAVWRRDIGRVVPDVLKNRISFLFRVKLKSKPLLSITTSASTRQMERLHIPEDCSILGCTTTASSNVLLFNCICVFSAYSYSI